MNGFVTRLAQAVGIALVTVCVSTSMARSELKCGGAICDAGKHATHEASKVKCGGAICDAGKHVGYEVSKGTQHAGKRIAAGWEHVKHDTGPAINQGALHLVKEIWNGLNWKTCKDAPNGCFERPLNVAAPQAPAEYPDVQLGTTSGPKIAAVVYNATIYSTEFEVNDLTTNTWVYRFTLGPWEKKQIYLLVDATGTASAVLRRDHTTDLRYEWIHPDEELH